MLDILVRGGLIVDGTGNAPYPGDLAVSDGRIAAVGRLEGAQAKVVLDAAGLVVAPGFIDMHSHSDLSLPAHPRASSSLAQGITTEVAGSCGWSLAPVKNETARTVLKGLCESLLGSVPKELAVEDPDAQGAASGASVPPPIAWHSFGEYLEYVENQGMGVNLYPVVGQSLIRAHVVGTERRPSTPGELAAQKALVEACLDEGARGLSTGRAYAPGCYASTEEIIELCRPVARRGGIYSSHIKDESANLIDAVAEAIRIGRESGASIEVSHHKAIGPANFGKVAETLAMMEQARASGVDVTCDCYPYAFAQVFSMLTEIPGITLDLSDDEIRDLLAKDSFRAKVASDLVRASTEEHGAPGYFSRPERMMFISLGRDHALEGQPLTSVFGSNPFSAARGPETSGPAATPATPTAPDPAKARALVDVCLDFLVSQDLHVYLAAIMGELDVETVLGHPQTMVGTDAFTVDADLGPRVPIHPRHFGTFPRVLGHYRRERGLTDLATMVSKVTGLPARKLGLTERGLLARGMWADLDIFDPETIGDRATAREPYLAPMGLRWVVVNGRLAAENGHVTENRAGMVLRRR